MNSLIYKASLILDSKDVKGFFSEEDDRKLSMILEEAETLDSSNPLIAFVRAIRLIKDNDEETIPEIKKILVYALENTENKPRIKLRISKIISMINKESKIDEE